MRHAQKWRKVKNYQILKVKPWLELLVPRQLDNHQPLQSYICTAHVVLSCRPDNHSLCTIRLL